MSNLQINRVKESNFYQIYQKYSDNQQKIRYLHMKKAKFLCIFLEFCLEMGKRAIDTTKG